MSTLKVRDQTNTGWHSLGGIGSSGAQGVQGVQGFQGTTGPQGVGGSQGPKGNQGYQGTSGYQGNQGEIGNQGYQGTQGGSGNQGPAGIEGDQGFQGEIGNQGYQGTQGGSGNQGPAGIEGDQGFQGEIGNQGYQGTQGAAGNQGNDGAAGTSGNQGFQGNEGNQGWQGTQGGSGNQGFQGVQGAVGIAGIIFKGAWDSGTTYDPGDAVTHSGTSYVCLLESTNNTPPNATYWQVLAVQGSQGNVGPQGPPGNQGNQGEDGVQGATGPGGNQGVTGAGGPQGVPGDQGNQGEDGVQGVPGNAGQQGVPGNQGVPGDQGNQGEDGVQGVPGNQGPTGLAGQQGVDGQQGATGILGDALAHSVLIDAGGSFKIGSGTKDSDLNGVFMDNTEIVLQKDGENVLVMTAAGTFNFIVGSGDNLTVSSGGGILVQAGGSVTLEAGGDLNFGLSDSDPSLLNWGDTYYMGAATTESRGVGIWPATGGNGYFKVGWDPVDNHWQGFDKFAIYAVNYGFLQIYGIGGWSQIVFTPGELKLGALAGSDLGEVWIKDGEIQIKGIVYPANGGADDLGKTDKYWDKIFGNVHYTDAQFRTFISAGDPILNFDTNDYIHYNRASNYYAFYAGATLAATLSYAQLWIQGDVSASGFIDRSKEFVGSNALDQLKAIKPVLTSVKGDWAEVDHTTLPEGVRSITKALEKGVKDEEGRDLGAYISLISKAVQELSAKLDTLKIQ